MKKTDQLFIRACKSLNPDIRLRSVYRRFYGKYNEVDENLGLSSVLTDIVDDYFPMSINKYLREKSSYNLYCKLSNSPSGEVEKNIWIMRDHIRWQERSKLEDLGVATPLRFRKKENK